MESKLRSSLLIIVLVGCCVPGGCSRDDSQVPLTDPGYGALLPTVPGKNLIVISFDALRADALGAYGDTLAASPNMDAFAQTTLVCERAYSAGQATPSSFAAAFTGCYPFSVFRKWNLIQTTTLAGVLQEGGYRTAAFLNNRQLDEERGFGQGFMDYHVVFMPDEERFLDLPQAWLKENADEKFFLWVHFISPHAPYDRRAMAEGFYTPGYEGVYEQGTGSLGRGETVDDLRDLARVKDLYTGEVFYADALFGELIATLEELGLMNDSVVVLTADHGDEHMDHGAIGHRQVYDEVVRVPLMIHHPHLQRGRRTAAPIMNIDFLPTFAAMLDLEVPAARDGVNVLAEPDPERPFISTAMTNNRWYSMGLRRGDYKLIAACAGRRVRTRLFNLVEDPGELNDLSGSKRRVAAAMSAELEGIIGGEPCAAIRKAVKGATVETDMSEEKIRQLRSLGYVD